MVKLLRRIITYRYFPLSFTLFTVILLCIPGSMVPGVGLFGIEHLDKVIHFILFGMNVLFWGLRYHHTNHSRPSRNRIYLALAAAGIALGVIMEFVQLNFVPNRSFDTGDILADALGCIAAALFLIRT